MAVWLRKGGFALAALGAGGGGAFRAPADFVVALVAEVALTHIADDGFEEPCGIGGYGGGVGGSGFMRLAWCEGRGILGNAFQRRG